MTCAAARVLGVGKSLGTWGAARPSALGLDAAWLMPLLTDAAATAPPRSYPARQLVVPGDHVLRVVGDPVASVLHHGEVARAFDTWLAEGSC